MDVILNNGNNCRNIVTNSRMMDSDSIISISPYKQEFSKISGEPLTNKAR